MNIDELISYQVVMRLEFNYTVRLYYLQKKI